ncbi:MAG: hypothetical protein AB7K08_14505 [Microbacteriaceae bacterium]
MRRETGWAIVVGLSLLLAGCSAADTGEASSDQNPSGGPTFSATPEPTTTSGAQPAPDLGEPADEQTDDMIGDHGDEDEPTPPPFDVDVAAPVIVTGSIQRDVTLRYGASEMIAVSPRSFAVVSANGTTTITVGWHLLGVWGYHFNSPLFVVAPATWTPSTSCGTTPPDSVPMSSASTATAGVYQGNDISITSTFVTTAPGPWYLVVRDGTGTVCNLAAWTIPLAGASR